MISTSVNTTNFVVREICPLCGKSERAWTIFDKPLYSGDIWLFLENYYQGRLPHSVVDGVNYTVIYCESCDFYWQKNILNDEWTLQLYELWIDPKESLDKQLNQSVKHRLQLSHRIAQELMCLGLAPKTQPKVLDFGGGWGQWCLAAKALGCRTYLFELSNARKQYNERQGIDFLTDLKECEAHRFDLINASQTFEHIPNPANSLKQLRRLVKHGGGIHIDTPNAAIRAPLELSQCAAKGPFQPLEHVNGFTPKSLSKLLEFSGFTPMECPAVALVLDGTRSLVSTAKHLLVQKSWIGRYLKGKPRTAILGQVLDE